MARTIKYGRPLKNFVRVGPADIAYMREGDPQMPTVLFLHGATTNSALWQKVLKQTNERLDAIAIDLPGMGDTDISPYEDFSVPSIAELVMELLERMSLEDVTFVAHDYGGAVAQIIAAGHPDLVKNLVLVDSVSRDHWPIPLARQAQRLARLPGTAELLRAGRFIENSRIGWKLATGPLGFARGYYNPDVIDADLIREYLRPLTEREGRERARHIGLSADSRCTTEILAKLRQYDRPCRVLWGADDKFLSPSWGIELAGDIPSAEFYLLPYCGHFAPDERPELVARHVVEVVEGRPATDEPLSAA